MFLFSDPRTPFGGEHCWNGHNSQLTLQRLSWNQESPSSLRIAIMAQTHRLLNSYPVNNCPCFSLNLPLCASWKQNPGLWIHSDPPTFWAQPQGVSILLHLPNCRNFWPPHHALFAGIPPEKGNKMKQFVTTVSHSSYKK